MKLLLVGGFLGSGKTTVLSRLIPAMEADHTKVAVIENEFGSCSMDDCLLKTESVRVIAISGGCVCCQLAADLITALADIEENIAPDWCVVELSGMAITADTLSVLRQYYRRDLMIYTIVLIDAQRWPALSRIAGPRINAQMDGADLLLLAKTDLTKDFPVIDTGIPIRKSTENLWQLIRDADPLSQNVHNAFNSRDVQIPGSVCSREFHRAGLFSFEKIKEDMQKVMEEEAQKIAQDGLIAGHIKALARFHRGSIFASMTTLHDISFMVTFEGKKTEIVEYYDLTVNVLTVAVPH